MTGIMSNTQWVLIRGWARESAHWGDFPGRLAQAFPGSQVRVLDQPGTGVRLTEDAPGSMPAIVDALRSALRSDLGPSKVRLVSISMGSMIASCWAHLHPEDLEGVVLMNPSFRGLSPWHKRLRPQALLKVIRAVTASTPKEIERHILELVSNRPDLREETLERWVRIFEERPISRKTVLKQLLAAATWAVPREAPTGVPFLLLNSLGDRMVDPVASEALQKKWNIPMRRHPWAGHDLALDDPDWVLEQIRAWSSAV